MFGAPSRFAPASAARRAAYADVDVTARIEGASPHGLVQILLEELLKGLDTLRAAERSGTGPRHGGVQARVVSILQSLKGGLDHARGGDVARTLDRVYREGLRLVTTPSGASRASALDTARAMLGDIAAAWAGIA